MTPSPSFDIGVFLHGSKWNPRSLVQFRATIDAAAGLDERLPLDRPAFLCPFIGGRELYDHFHAAGQSVRGFTGPVVASHLIFDLDGPETDLDATIEGGRRLVRVILSRYRRLDPERLQVYFSGSKGLHVALPLDHCPPPSVEFPRTCRTLGEDLATLAHVRIDPAVFVKTQPLRLVNSRHEKTNLRKRLLDHDELFALDAAAIRELAREPRPFEIAWPVLTDADPVLIADWNAAAVTASQSAASRAAILSARRADPAARAPRWFGELLRRGCEEGERHRTLFRAGAWLGEVGCPLAAAIAILSEPGERLGLKPSDVRRQIESGWNHSQTQQKETP